MHIRDESLHQMRTELLTIAPVLTLAGTLVTEVLFCDEQCGSSDIAIMIQPIMVMPFLMLASAAYLFRARCNDGKQKRLGYLDKPKVSSLLLEMPCVIVLANRGIRLLPITGIPCATDICNAMAASLCVPIMIMPLLMRRWLVLFMSIASFAMCFIYFVTGTVKHPNQDSVVHFVSVVIVHLLITMVVHLRLCRLQRILGNHAARNQTERPSTLRSAEFHSIVIGHSLQFDAGEPHMHLDVLQPPHRLPDLNAASFLHNHVNSAQSASSADMPSGFELETSTESFQVVMPATENDVSESSPAKDVTVSIWFLDGTLALRENGVALEGMQVSSIIDKIKLAHHIPGELRLILNGDVLDKSTSLHALCNKAVDNGFLDIQAMKMACRTGPYPASGQTRLSDDGVVGVFPQWVEERRPSFEF
eukprot:gnl/MRDRNA2_/MRDRNA2_85899_c0_seq4.p1 gnl/MRDRNA2_/MRDRNA2_85899_c0~~gnl/MRDRNA2_/MRDRNA2_85899_c0_seq4.p1  ORF type:complete len:419 (+),score=61.16 gnl/MRDRNA2_/MRDRNA2_85899_c0_seq4:140-1396(+)